jgi:hypothetical protein
VEILDLTSAMTWTVCPDPWKYSPRVEVKVAMWRVELDASLKGCRRLARVKVNSIVDFDQDSLRGPSLCIMFRPMLGGPHGAVQPGDRVEVEVTGLVGPEGDAKLRYFFAFDYALVENEVKAVRKVCDKMGAFLRQPHFWQGLEVGSSTTPDAKKAATIKAAPAIRPVSHRTAEFMTDRNHFAIIVEAPPVGDASVPCVEPSVHFIDEKRETHALMRAAVALPLGRGRTIVRVWLPLPGRFEVRLLSPAKGVRSLIYVVEATEFVHSAFRSWSEVNQASLGYPVLKSLTLARGILLMEPFSWRLQGVTTRFTVLVDLVPEAKTDTTPHFSGGDGQRAVDALWHRSLTTWNREHQKANLDEYSSSYKRQTSRKSEGAKSGRSEDYGRRSPLWLQDEVQKALSHCVASENRSRAEVLVLVGSRLLRLEALPTAPRFFSGLVHLRPSDAGSSVTVFCAVPREKGHLLGSVLTVSEHHVGTPEDLVVSGAPGLAT